MWTKEKYNDLINDLFKESNQKYIDFSKKITNPGTLIMIGVNIPKLRIIAKSISKTNIESYIKCYIGKYFEERMILGFVIGYSNDLDIYNKYLWMFSKEITEWSVCDSTSSTMKLIKKHNEEFMPLIIKLINTNNEFQVRFGLVLLMDYYINDKYINQILNICINIKSKYYYVNMALSWLLCECFIKNFGRTDIYINSMYLDKFVLNKTISKICDSYRVSNETKQELKKRRLN